MVLLATGWAVLVGACEREGAPVPPATRQTPPPAVKTDDGDALRRMQAIEQASLAHLAARRHGPVWALVETLESLTFHHPANAARRDKLTGRLRAKAGKTRDELHRFLFAELGPLPTAERKRLLASADAGDVDVIEEAARILATHQARTDSPHLRRTATGRAGRTDPQTGLPIRFAGRVGNEWKKRFNEAFNDHMRSTVATSRPQSP